MKRATSATVFNRPKALADANRAKSLSFKRAVIGVGRTPGRTALTRMLCSPTSLASAAVSPSRPALAAA